METSWPKLSTFPEFCGGTEGQYENRPSGLLVSELKLNPRPLIHENRRVYPSAAKFGNNVVFARAYR
jgi:hypothetical protein